MIRKLTSGLIRMSHSKILQSRSQTSGSICPLKCSCCCLNLQHRSHSSRNTHSNDHKNGHHAENFLQESTTSDAGNACHLKFIQQCLEHRFLCDFHRTPQNGSLFVGTNVPEPTLCSCDAAKSGNCARGFFLDPKKVSGR